MVQAQHAEPPRFISLISFYNKHFPTDRHSYNVRVPIIGLLFSICAIHIITDIFIIHYTSKDLVIYAYIFTSCSVAYGLYWGLKIGDRKHYTPWLIFKFFEMVIIIIAGALDLGQYKVFFYDDKIIKGIYVIVILVFDFLIFMTIMKKMFDNYNSAKNNRQTDLDEDIYNNI